jgi:non-ribosomal peptide synthetase-like protein
LIFAGTPMKARVLRALGVRVGRRLLDDGSAVPEHTLTTLGDAVTLNSGATIQRHSPEDGTVKSDRSEIGDGATVGVPTFVHYGVTMGEGSCWTRTRS